MKKIFTRLFAVLLLSLVCTSAWAQFENGKVYRIVCSGTTTVSLGASALTDVAAVSTSETEKTQQWYVTVNGSNYTFRNLANGRYLQGNNATSNAWGLTEESNNFTVTAVNGNYAIRGASHSNGYGYMHKDGSNNIVSWESGAANSQWTPIEVSYTAEELQAVWDEVESLVVPSTTVDTYEGYLDVLFSDKSCVTPKLATLDAAKATEAYNNLPVTLQKMVDKVYGGDWTESTVAPADRPNGNNNTNHSLWTVANTWDNDYAKKFRVQMYEPYSVEGEITSYLRINAHCNMDNPTGIYANAGEPMYIMVEGTIAEGAELWVAHQVGHGATNYYNNAAYTQLHEGLNVVPYFADGSQLWINYLVHTYNDSEKTIAEKFPHKLSEYKPLKIHIEGGKINGFFNAMGDYRATTTDTENLWGEVDNDADWNYYKARAALSGDFALLGHRQTLLFDFGTYNSTKGHFGVANAEGGIEYALAYHLENITVPETPNCYAGSGKAFGNYSDTYYPGMQLSATTGKINIMLEAWDRIQYSEHASLGLLSVANMEKMNALYPRWTTAGEAAEIYNYGEATINNVTQTYQQFCQGIDYSEYYNHHGAAVGAGSGYMSGGWRVCNYHYNTMGSIIGKIADEAGPTWGPAHEIGHQHQNIFNLNGQTEVTNNFHANVAVWYMGMGTSRYNGSEGNLEHVLGAYNTDGNDLYTNNIWALTHLYYRLWLYYHLAGNNTQFWPRLFELLRQVPIVNGGQISGETSLLRFYQHACDAAGEDLTEFFRAHGFFEIMTDRLVGDYSNGTYNVTEEQIETAISAVKAKNYPVNYAVLLINDGTSETTLKHDGESKRALWDNNPSAEYGSVTDFIEGNTSVTTAYEATVSADGTVTMSGGTGGVGFLILNEKGEIVSFSNKASFEISDEAAYLLATGKAEIVAVDSKNNTEEAEVDLSAVQSSLIVTLVADVENLLKYVDDTYTKVGYYKASSVVDLQSALNTAKATIETGTGLAAAYELLYTEYQKVLNDENARVAIISGAKYAIKSKSGNDYMDVDDSGNVKTTASSTFPTDDSDLWIIEIASKDTYNIKNANTGKYLQEVSDANGVNFTVGDNAVNYGITNVDYVYHAFSTKKYSGRYMDRHSATQVATWGGIGENAKWFITLADNDLAEEASAIAELQALIAKAESLVTEVATVSLKGELQLQTDNANSAFFITSNATETGHEPKYLLDNNVSTFFHTVWWGTSPGADHYLQIDLGEEYPIDQFVFEYTNLPTTSNNVDAAEAITVQVANALDNFTTIANLTTSDSNPLPTAKGGTYTSATLGTKDASYRYIRLIVTDATGGMLSNHYYFGMSEFSLERLNSYSKVKDAYTGHITQDVVATVADKLADAKTAITNGDDIAVAKSNLQTAYDALLLEYNDVVDAKKTELQELIDATNELIAQVGEATVIAGGPVNLHGKLYAERPYTSGGESNSDYSSAENGYNLLDGNVNTHYHSDYDVSTMVSPPYLRVDLGKGNSARKVNFNYTTRNQTGCAPTKINVYGGVAGVAGVEYSQGAIQSSAALNAVTTPTKIVIKNLSGTNSKYFAGASNETDINAAVLVWEPVTEGVAGRYYLRTTDAVSGYIQNGNTTVELGTIDNAQVFVTTSPSTTGADATNFNGESLVNADLDNLVRFVQEGGSTWLNVQHGETGTPRLGHTGKGGYTVHNVYLVTETENDTPLYDATPIATFTSGDASNPLPTGTSAKWTSADMESTKDYRFFKFEVAESQGSKTENGNTKYYFAISEFGFNIVGVSSATINPEYQGLVSEELLAEARQEVDAAVTMKNIATSEDLLQAQITKLTEAKATLEAAMAQVNKDELVALVGNATTLYNKMSDGNGNMNADYATSSLTAEQLTAVKDALDAAQSVVDYAGSTQLQVNEAKNALNEKYQVLVLVEDTNEKNSLATDGLTTLIGNVNTLLGTIATEVASSKVALPLTTTTGADYSITTAGVGDGSLANLIDKNADGTGNTGTYYGSLWLGGVEAYSQYIEVDLGSGIALDELSFDYTTRDSGHSTERPKVIKLLGSNDKSNYVEIKEFTDGMPVGQCQQWTMAEMFELAARYRYIRFSVDSDNHSFHMSDFNVYTNIDYAVADYYTTATDLDFVELCLALQSAEDLLTRDYITTAQYNAVYEKLSTCFNNANSVVDADVDDRSALTELIALTETLIGDVATVTEVVAPVLSTSNLYCNADNSTNTGASADDKLGVAALLDGDLATHLHTTYGGNAQDDDLDHYIRVDMGEDKSVSAFEFSYTGRSANSNNDPSTMVIQGCNTLDGEWDEIKTLTGLPTEGDKVQYHSGMIEASVAYRYIRFMVTETQNNSKTTYNNIAHPFFVMSEFSFTAHSTIEVNEGYTNVTKELVRAAYNEKNTAAPVTTNEHYISSSDYTTVLANLQAAYNALNLAKNLGDIPVILTTDVNNPVLYKIQIKSNENVFTYDGETADASKKPVLAASELGNRYQAWYFMQGTNSESYEDILILPYFNEGEKNTTLRLSYANNNDGTDPAVVASGTNTTDNWYITFTSEGNNVTTEGWWNLQPEGGSDVNAYVNQLGGGDATRLAFWRNASNPSNNGSQFRFVLDETDYSLSDAYYALYNKYTELGGKLTGGTAIGDYTEASVTEYNDAYNTAGTLLEAKASTDDEYTAARETMENEYAAIEYVMPEEGKFYLIRSISTEAYCNGKYVHALCDKRPTNEEQNHKHLVFDALGDIAQYPLAVFVFEDINANGECKMKNLHTGMYVKSFTKNAEHMTTDYESAATVKIGNFAPGQAILRIGDTAPMHAQNANSVIVHWEAAAGNASLWSIDEVTDLSQIVHNVTMNATFSSVTLGYNATAPAGVRVYNAKGIDSGYVTLEKIADGDEANNVIPANTPVILYRADDVKTKTFSYTEATAAKPSESLLGGSLYTKYVECDDSDYYKLMIKNGEAKMYLMYKEFDANGTSLGETHDGGHIKCTANKIFMRVPGLSQAAVYSMRFINPETTDIDGVNAENGEEKTIYDLQGRKLTEITAPGIYIVNGKKVLVK